MGCVDWEVSALIFELKLIVAHINLLSLSLFQRYNCSFETKVRYAQAAGYAAAIVYNINSNDLGEKTKH